MERIEAVFARQLHDEHVSASTETDTTRGRGVFCVVGAGSALRRPTEKVSGKISGRESIGIGAKN
jgi:hypothetical protein